MIRYMNNGPVITVADPLRQGEYKSYPNPEWQGMPEIISFTDFLRWNYTAEYGRYIRDQFYEQALPLPYGISYEAGLDNVTIASGRYDKIESRAFILYVICDVSFDCEGIIVHQDYCVSGYFRTYVSKKEAAPYKNEIISLLKLVQKEVKEYFTFRFDFVGSSSRNMITCERNGNIGYDFDVNIEPNDPEEKYPASNIRRFIFDAIQKHMGKYGYAKIENSTSVITIKAIDRDNRRIEHSCDFAIVFHCSNGQQQYIRYNKFACSYSWEYRGNDYYIGDKLQWIKDNHLKEELRERYLIYKNRNNDPEKHSRTILAETVNNLYNEYTYRRR